VELDTLLICANSLFRLIYGGVGTVARIKSEMRDEMKNEKKKQS
jgi:hypothetical protein